MSKVFETNDRYRKLSREGAALGKYRDAVLFLFRCRVRTRLRPAPLNVDAAVLIALDRHSTAEEFLFIYV